MIKAEFLSLARLGPNGGISFSVFCLRSNFFHSKRLLLQGLTLEKSDLYLGVSDTAVGVAVGLAIVPSTSLVVVVYGDGEGVAVF